MVVLLSARAVIIGAGIGLALSLAVGRLFASVLYGAAGTEPAIVVLVAAILAAMTFAAAVMPARRAARADPIVAIRAD